MDITMTSEVEVTNKVVISFIPTHKLETTDISVSMNKSKGLNEDLICSTWKRINPKKENLMQNKNFMEIFACLIPITNSLCVVTFIDGSSCLYYCLNTHLIFKSVSK